MLYCLEFDQVKFYAQTCVCVGGGVGIKGKLHILLCSSGEWEGEMGGKGEGEREGRKRDGRV